MVDMKIIILLLIPVFLIQLGLQAYCIYDLVKRQNFKYFNRNIWAAIVILGNLLGAIVYLIFRGDNDDGDKG